MRDDSGPAQTAQGEAEGRAIGNRMWYAIGAFIVLASITVLGWWNYVVAQLLLEYLKAFLSWPVIAGLVLLYFVRSQNTVLSEVIARITKLGFPGGEVVLAPSYPPTVQAESEPVPEPTPPASSQMTEDRSISQESLRSLV